MTDQIDESIQTAEVAEVAVADAGNLLSGEGEAEPEVGSALGPGPEPEPLAARQPPDFNHPPAPGRSRLLTNENFVACTWLDDDLSKNPILLPQQHAEAYERRKDEKFEELQRENEEARRKAADLRFAETEARDEERRQKKQAEEAERAREAQRLNTEAALRKVGLSADAHDFRFQMEALPPSQRLQVFKPVDVKRLAAASQSVDSDLQKRNEAIAQALEIRGALRRVGLPLSVQAILALKEDHPHFGEVIEFVANHVALQKQIQGRGGDRPPVRLPPMLLFGPPGVGKTHFCEALAQVLGVPVRRHPMDQAETSSALLGSDMTWSNSRYGLIFEMLGLGNYANPVVILDELDKSRSTSTSNWTLVSPTSVLHSLLEPVSAAKVRDISLDLELDASLITWIATANYPWWVPATLRSRLKEFLITMPDAAQAIQVARSVVKAALRAAGAQQGEVSKQFVVAVAHLSAREIYQATMAAAAAAVRRGWQGEASQERVDVSDLPCEVLQSAEDGSSKQDWLH